MTELLIYWVFQEDNYPLRWGSRLLVPSEYRHVISSSVWDKFVCKEEEYLTPPAERIYCNNIVTSSLPAENRSPCGTFVSKLMSIQEIATQGRAGKTTQCDICNSAICLICGEVGNHLFCRPRRQLVEDIKAFEGLTKGKDYQVCPK